MEKIDKLKIISLIYYGEDLNKNYKKILITCYDIKKLANDETIDEIIKEIKRCKIGEEVNSSDKEYRCLDSILINNWGEGFKEPEDTFCDNYGKLINMLYDLGDFSSVDVNGIVDKLDEITYEN